MELAELEQEARQEARRMQEEVRHQLQLKMLKEEEAIKVCVRNVVWIGYDMQSML
jgi:hypothetical protein